MTSLFNIELTQQRFYTSFTNVYPYFRVRLDSSQIILLNNYSIILFNNYRIYYSIIPVQFNLRICYSTLAGFIQVYRSPFGESVSSLQVAQNRRPSILELSLQFFIDLIEFFASSHKALGTRLKLHRRESRRGDTRRHGGAHHAGRDADTADTAGRHGVSPGFLLYVYHCNS